MIEATPLSIIHASSQDNVPIYPAPSQDNAPIPSQDNAPIDIVPNQDSSQRSRTRRVRDKCFDHLNANKLPFLNLFFASNFMVIFECCVYHSRSTQPVSLVKWNVFEKQRPDGRVDKYYRHKEHKFVCRSKLEVNRYETSGVRPQRPKKIKFNEDQEKMERPSNESDIDLDDVLAFSQLSNVPKTIIDRFDDE
ncbi:hypothetical protein V6N12_031375 [Hibiscus sabdariffa]|uniref:Uncharacterized protein n=1 Tax=Hibiscus sabdariffa TaxID=183260 RepID=A0ABR2B2G7_9ROSI